MTQSPRSLSPIATAYVLGVSATGVAIWAYCIWDLVRNPVELEWLILVALTVGSGWATLRVPAMPISFSISDMFNIAAALLFGPSAGALSAAVDGLVLSARMERSLRSLDRVIFNMAAVSIALWVAAQVFVLVESSRPAPDGPMEALWLLGTLLLFGAVDFGLNSGIVAMAVAFERRMSMGAIWRAHLAGMWITYFGGIFGAMMVTLLARFNTVETLILIVPLPVILYVTFRHALGRVTDQIDHLANINRVYVGAIGALTHAVDAKDEVTHDHTRRVQERTVRLARAMAIDDESELQAIRTAALLHDVGKLAIPEHILNKPGALTPAEYEIMKRHAAIGADILSVIGFPYDVAPIVRHHHEHWDGTGYPDGLAGERIPMGARILAVVDCYDALISDRPYRARMRDHDALKILKSRRGNMYDPHVVDTFLALQVDAPVAAPFARALPRAEAVFAPPGEEAERREFLDLQAFFHLGQALAAPGANERLGEILWTYLQDRLPASAFALYGYDEASHALVAVYVASEGADGLGLTPIAVGERVSGWAASTGQTAMNSDARLDLDDPLRDVSTLRSALAVPVRSGGRLLAVLTFYADAANVFHEDHRRLVETAGRLLVRSGATPRDNVFLNDTRVLNTSRQR